MVVRAIVTNVIVDANVADVTTQVELTDKANSMDIVYIGNGKIMIVEATKT